MLSASESLAPFWPPWKGSIDAKLGALLSVGGAVEASDAFFLAKKPSIAALALLLLVDDALLGVGDAFLAGCFLFIGAIVMRLCVSMVGRGAPGDGRGSWS